MELRKSRVRLKIRKKFFSPRVMRLWNRPPREVVAASFLIMFKARLDEAVS